MTEVASETGVEQSLKLWVVLSRAFDAVQAHAQADVARRGLTIMEFGVMEVLYHKGPLTLGEVQRKILVTSGGVTYLVDRLAAKGLVERRRCETDRRAYYAALTPEGEALIAEIFPKHAAAVDRALGGLDEAQKEQAITLLRALGRYAADAPKTDG